MRYFDLHCDTMTECAEKEIPLRSNSLHVDLDTVKEWEHYIQCYAVWLPDDLRGDAAWQRFLKVARRFSAEVEENQNCLAQLRDPGDLDTLEAQGRHGAILTVESGAALGGDLEHIKDFKRLGVRMCTLTWNGATELGRGVMAPGTAGLTEFGRKAVKEMERAGILVDLSHASPELFWDVAEIAEKPLVASHSNAKELCGHPRNLTKEQFEAIRKSGGLVGLNFYRAFLNDQPEKASMEDVLRHADYFLSLGGEDVLAMGGDWDGAELPEDMPGLASIPKLYERFLRQYPEALVEKIFYGNAARVFREQKLL
ncbi:MAG: dipeptidase [Acutalibacter sp.]|jgi:membrane dipeptidase